MAKTAELKTSAVTNWLVDWLLALERSDLHESREGRQGRGEYGPTLRFPLRGGEKERGEVQDQCEGYKRELAPTSVTRLRSIAAIAESTEPNVTGTSNRAVT